MIPEKPCQECWETYQPTSHQQKYCPSCKPKIALKRSHDTPWYKLRFAVLARDEFTCRYCGKQAPEAQLHIDHVTPRSKGGMDEMDNLVVACVECNLGKGDVLLEQRLIAKITKG